MVWVEGGNGAWLAKHTFTGPANTCKASSTTKDTSGGLAKTGV